MHIGKLDHQSQQQAFQIWNLFHAAYEIEAQVLALQNFRPLNRTIHQIQQAETTFYGGQIDTILVAAMELEWYDKSHVHINGFGVSPNYFRQGYGSQLLTAVLDELDWQQVTVGTAVANTPALALYRKHGFIPQEQWTTPDSIQMVTLYK